MAEIDYREKIRARRRRTSALALIIISAAISVYAIVTYLNIIPGLMLIRVFATGILGIVIIEVVAHTIFMSLKRGAAHPEARTLADLFKVIAYVVLILILLAMIVGLQYLSGVLVGAGFLGIVLGLAAQSTLSNFISGIYLLTSNAFQPSDKVMIITSAYSMQPPSFPHDQFLPGYSGTIETIGLLYTKLINEEGVPFYMPNSVVSQSIVMNYHRATEPTRNIEFDIDVKVPYSKVRAVIKQVMKDCNIKSYTVSVKNLHMTFYVVKIHITYLGSDISAIKDSLFSVLLPLIAQK